MPVSTISGFIKKKTVSQLFRRSPRQLTRDITIALEMRDETVLPHLRIRNEDGSIVEGQYITPTIIKNLCDEGTNPMWYLRRERLEKAYEPRKAGEGLKGESVESENPDPRSTDVPKESETSSSNIVGLMQETIRELKRDKELLGEQLKIKDEQIRETTARWKESNYIEQGLNQRLESHCSSGRPISRHLGIIAVTFSTLFSHNTGEMS